MARITRASKGKNWQRWTEADGTVRYGVASDEHPSALRIRTVGQWERARVIAPADGGEPFAIVPAGKGAHCDWKRAGDETPMVPALLQDCLPGLDAMEAARVAEVETIPVVEATPEVVDWLAELLGDTYAA